MNKVWVGWLIDRFDGEHIVSIFASQELANKWFHDQLAKIGINTNEWVNDMIGDLYVGRDYMFYSSDDGLIEIECNERKVHETEDWDK